MPALSAGPDRDRGDEGRRSDQGDRDDEQQGHREHVVVIGSPRSDEDIDDGSRSCRRLDRRRTIRTTDTAIPPAQAVPLHSGTMIDAATRRPSLTGNRPRSAAPTPSRSPGGILVAALLLMLLTGGRSAAQTMVTFETFGLGNAYRPGGPVAARVLVTSDLDEPVPGLVEWEIPNPDGDRQINQRPIEIPARGGTASAWLIGDLPSRIDPLAVANEPWTVRVFEYRDGERIAEIATARLDPSVCAARPVPQADGLAIVIGPNDAGLGGYAAIPGRDGRPGLNELLTVVPNVEPRDLPDVWAGFDQADLIVWTADDPRFQPGTLGTRLTIEGALRSWLERGGHLVIALPRSGDPWRLERGDGVLNDLLEGVSPITESTWPLAQALPALSDRPGLRDPDRTITLHRFDPATLPPAWRPLAGFRPAAPPFDRSSVSIPEGTPPAVAAQLIASAEAAVAAPAPVIHAIRRDVGQGTLDLVGIDPSDPDIRVQQPQGLPATWVFWNPLLGRRTFTPSASIVDDLAARRELVQSSQSTVLGSQRMISEEIGLRGSANGGRLLAIAIFGGYWLIAGPLGFSVLGRMGRRRHAWTAFVATSLVAAGVGWVAGELAVVIDTPLRHLTVLRHRYAPEASEVDTPLDHATCWFSTRLPGYGTARVTIGAVDGSAAAPSSGVDLLRHFSPPPNGFEAGFLDSARYEVDARRRGSIEAPARATSAEFVGDWLGRPRERDGVWASTIKVDPDDPIRIEMLDRTLTSISGTLVNGTGTTLTDVLVLMVSPVRSAPLPLDDRGLPGLPGVADRLTAQMPNLGNIMVVSIEEGWAPDAPLALGGPKGIFGSAAQVRAFGRNALGTEIEARFPAAEAFEQAMIGTGSAADRRRGLQALSLFQSLQPPPIVQTSSGQRSAARFIRLLGRDLDLSRCLAEPGIVVLAFAENTPCPVPIHVDDELVDGEGTVLLQWIHPIPPDPAWLVPPRPETFDDSTDAARADRVHPESQPRGVAAAWR